MSAINLASIREEAIASSTLSRQPLLRHFTEPVVSAVAPMGPSTFDPSALTNRIYRFIVGVDTGRPNPLSEQETNESLGDPFAKLIVRQGKFPLTLNTLLSEFESTRGKPNGLQSISVFHIAEGGEIPWGNATTDKVDRLFRLVFVLGVAGGIDADVMISTGIANDSETQFLQLMSWDPVKNAFNFYQRLHKLWVWSGNSFHSLDSASRNKGPFSGHVNGGPNMKELKEPWVHWRSPSTTSFNPLPPGDPFLTNRFFADSTVMKTADIFERTIRSAFSHTNTGRLAKALTNGTTVDNPIHLLRQLLDTTNPNVNLNLTSSFTSMGAIDDTTQVDLPFTFFANVEALSSVGINANLTQINVPGALYLANIKAFNIRVQSDEKIEIPGDTHFVFVVPEPAAEDTDLLSKMVNQGIISSRLAACLLMVDFSNPIFSKSRAALQQYVPDQLTIGNNGKDLDEKFAANVVASNQHTTDGTPEKAFFDNWIIPATSLVDQLQNQLLAYFTLLQTKVGTQEGWNDIVTLAESRRSQFKERPLFEFSLTLPTTDVPTDSFPLEITPQGIIRTAT